MRILHLVWALAGGGAERQLAEIAPELAQRGHDVHVAFTVPGVYAARLAASACTLHQIAKSWKYDPLVLPRLVGLVRRVRPDVMHTWLTQMDIAGGLVSRLLRIPWVMSERSSASLYPPILLNRARVAVGRHADLVAANSAGGGDYWKDHGVAAARIVVIPNFVPVREIESAPPLDDPRIAEGDELVLYVGRLAPEKNLPRLIEAMAIVCRGRPRARLALCGDGILREALAAQVRAAALEERVVFTGFVPNVPSWLKRANALAAVSFTEGHPNAVLEAIAAGAPLVLSDIPAYRAVAGEDAASFVPVGDAEAMAEAIAATLADRDAALRRAARARDVIAPLSLDATITRFEDAYRCLRSC
jgi:glycosyltransferase involved in cell wall biosynthesis